jgi:2-polyprenyl-3-methyl-5-hydroxy-6-metoxy-1,4-benzoquinol methylase
MFREKIILSLIENKKVLDIGSFGQTDEYSLWELYQDVKMKSLTGIDLPNEQESINKTFKTKKNVKDLRILSGNMETYNFNEKFEIIIAGDIIEHVYNQGLFLNNIYKHLEDDGKLIMTTPNAKWLTVFLIPNATHTLWHDRYTLSYLLKQHGFKIDVFNYYPGNKKSYNIFKRFLAKKQSMFLICSKMK